MLVYAGSPLHAYWSEAAVRNFCQERYGKNKILFEAIVAAYANFLSGHLCGQPMPLPFAKKLKHLFRGAGALQLGDSFPLCSSAGVACWSVGRPEDSVGPWGLSFVGVWWLFLSIAVAFLDVACGSQRLQSLPSGSSTRSPCGGSTRTPLLLSRSGISTACLRCQMRSSQPASGKISFRNAYAICPGWMAAAPSRAAW
jgi:hypothetical protein